MNPPTRKKISPRYYLSEKEKNLIWAMFWGPYKKGWKNNKGIVDNTTVTISKRIGVRYQTVDCYLDMRLGALIYNMNSNENRN